MYYVYILQSERNGSFYTGFTKDVEKRLSQHNEGKVKATKRVRPFKIVYSEAYQNATEARRREYYIKSQKSRKFIEQLIAGGG
ncbi:MAG: GIY-YIG nuclease family protein [Dehalococcoidia bacterium]